MRFKSQSLYLTPETQGKREEEQTKHGVMEFIVEQATKTASSPSCMRPCFLEDC
jgi:hypothetical protein